MKRETGIVEHKILKGSKEIKNENNTITFEVVVFLREEVTK